MFEKLTNDNITMFAIKHYDNPQCEGEGEFHDDMIPLQICEAIIEKVSRNGRTKRTSDT